MAFWRARELTKEANYLRSFIIPIHIVSQLIAALTSCFSSKWGLWLTKWEAKAQALQSCGSDHCLAFSLPCCVKHQLFSSAICRRFRKEQPAQKSEVPWDGNKHIWWLAIIRCQAVSEWWVPSVLTWSVSNYMSAGFGVAAQPKVWASWVSARAFCDCVVLSVWMAYLYQVKVLTMTWKTFL